MNLYCDNKYLRDSVLSAEFVGSVTGLILLSILADRLGRKTIIVSTIYLTFMGAICKQISYLVLTLGAMNNILALLYVGQVLMGFGGYSLSMVSYSYLS
jgi:MFS family permease